MPVLQVRGRILDQKLTPQIFLRLLNMPADKFERLGAAKRHAHSVQRDRVVAADRIEIGQRCPSTHVVLGVHLQPRYVRTLIDHRLMMLEAQPDPRLSRNRVALRPSGRPKSHALHAYADVFPPWILPQSPAGSRTNDFGSRACVAWPAHEWAPSAQSFLAAALMP